MKPVDVKRSKYIDTSQEIIKIYLDLSRFKIGDFVRISKYKNLFAKGYFPNWSDEVCVIKKFKNNVPWTYAISDLKGKN